MSSLESRIFTEATATAAEVTPTDIPPLRPGPTHAAGRNSRSGRHDPASAPGSFAASGSASGRRWLIPLAAAASVAALVAVLVTVRPGQNPAHHRFGPPAVSALTRGQAMLAAQALDNYFPATGAQYTAGLAFEWTIQKLQHQLVSPCMARAGFRQPAFTATRRKYVLSYADNSQFPDLAQRASRHNMGDSLVATGWNVPPSGAGALKRCTAEHAAVIGRLGAASGTLVTKWLNIITRIESSAAVRAMRPAFSSCLQAHGIPAAYAQQRSSASNPLFVGFFAWMDRLGQTSTNNRQLNAQAHHWTPVFVECAGPTVKVVERLQLAARATFFKKYARRIARIKSLAVGLARTYQV